MRHPSSDPLTRYRFSVSGSVVEKIDGFEAYSDSHAIATAHNRLKSGEFIFLESAELDRRDGSNLVPIARFKYTNRTWLAYKP